MVDRIGARLRGIVTSRIDLLLIGVLVLGLWAVAGGPGAPVVGGLALVAGVSAILHLRGEVSETRRLLRRRLEEIEHRGVVERNGLRAAHAAAVEELRRQVDDSLRSGREESSARIDAVAREQTAALERLARETRSDATDVRALVRTGLGTVRREIDGVREQLPRPVLAPVDVSTREAPLLSIAIPGYDRPAELERCLASIVEQVEALGVGTVEVWVTDDGSPDARAVTVAHRYATEHDYIGFRENSTNLGLERNLLESCRPCRGEFLWVMGNDDFLCPGGLAVVLDALDGAHDVALFAKTRVDREVQRTLGNSNGLMPVDLAEGERRSYPTLLSLARETGLVSGFGFISTLVFRRAPFVDTAPDPYFGLSMYPQLGVLLESLALAPTLACNTPVVFHRTQTAIEKLAEAAGRRDEGFMAGGAERDSRWFGAGFAALLQRVVDRSAVEAADLAVLPERLFGEERMIDWLARNRAEGVRRNVLVDDEVGRDADRLFAATGVGEASDDRRAAEARQPDGGRE